MFDVSLELARDGEDYIISLLMTLKVLDEDFLIRRDRNQYWLSMAKMFMKPEQGITIIRFFSHQITC